MGAGESWRGQLFTKVEDTDEGFGGVLGEAFPLGEVGDP
jgi:hypothetical protein